MIFLLSFILDLHFSDSHVWTWELNNKKGWVPKNWCLWNVVLGKLMKVPWTVRGSNQSILKEINPEYSLEGLMLKLRYSILVTWCEQLTHWKRPWCWERLRAGEGGVRGWDGCMASLMQWKWTQTNSGRWWGTGRPAALQSMGSQKIRHDWVTEQQQQHV